MNGLFKEKESGVSPVIGVMLMIVVTVIIAAVVSGFASGVTDTSTDVPIASFDFKIYSNHIYASTGDINGGSPMITGTMKGGEAIDTSDLKMVFYWEDDDGTIHKHTYSTGAAGGGFASHSGPSSSGRFGDDGFYWHAGDQFNGFPIYVMGTGVTRGEKFEINIIHEPTNTVIWSDEVTVI